MGLDVKEPVLPLFMAMDIKDISQSYSLRCDAKQAQPRFKNFDKYIGAAPSFELGEYLPTPVVKGIQPKYLEDLNSTGVQVVNTLSIRNLTIKKSDCRIISDEDFESLDSDRKCRHNDILLTVDGGTSIGKAAIFNFDQNFTVDSHVAILRPEGINPLVILYLLASPVGQLQFQRAESGASGQTAVTEDDIRRFRFPIKDLDVYEKLVKKMDKKRLEIEKKKEQLNMELEKAWVSFSNELLIK